MSKKPPDPLCSSKGCFRSGRYVPMICVPPTGIANDVENMALKIIITLPLCRRHLQQVKAEDFLDHKNSNFREVFEMMATGRVPPDIQRAWIKRIRIGSIEYMSTPLADSTPANQRKPREAQTE